MHSLSVLRTVTRISLFPRILFASSVLNLTELVALRPDLGKLKKILYFHENQLVYPVKKCQERDFQYGYNQILSWQVQIVSLYLILCYLFLYKQLAFKSGDLLYTYLDQVRMPFMVGITCASAMYKRTVNPFYKIHVQ